jgi:hypothetical protein
MKLLLALLFSCTFFISQHAAAHGDHEYQEPRLISEPVALIIAQRATTSMTRKDAGLGFGQLQQSWSAVPKDDMAIHKKGSGYYVVSVFNKGEEKTLYVLMSQVGEVYDANLTGEFDGI